MEGEAAAQSALIERHKADLRRYVDRRMGNRLTRNLSSADICQDVFLRVFRSLHDLPEDATEELFRARLFRNARWVIANHISQVTRIQGESAIGEPANPPDPRSLRVDGSVTTDDESRWLGALIDRLGPTYGELIRMRMQGLPFAQIAERCGATEATVRQRFSRALRELRTLTDNAQAAE